MARGTEKRPLRISDHINPASTAAARGTTTGRTGTWWNTSDLRLLRDLRGGWCRGSTQECPSRDGLGIRPWSDPT
ncbi:hypothetical protein GCM10009600_25150 [Oerskovia paurometabola]